MWGDECRNNSFRNTITFFCFRCAAELRITSSTQLIANELNATKTVRIILNSKFRYNVTRIDGHRIRIWSFALACLFYNFDIKNNSFGQQKTENTIDWATHWMSLAKMFNFQSIFSRSRCLILAYFSVSFVFIFLCRFFTNFLASFFII